MPFPLSARSFHGRVLEVPHAESEHRQENATFAPVLDEILESSAAADTNVEIAIGRENNAVDAAFDEAFGGDFVSKLNALASRCGATGSQAIDRTTYRPFVGARR